MCLLDVAAIIATRNTEYRFRPRARIPAEQGNTFAKPILSVLSDKLDAQQGLLSNGYNGCRLRVAAASEQAHLSAGFCSLYEADKY